MMDVELAKRLLHEVKKYRFCDKVFLNLMGEPLLYPQLFELLDYSCAIRQKIALTTNGTKLDDDVITGLLKYPNVQVAVSHHSHDRVSFQYKHAPGSYERYNGRLFEFIERKFQCNAKNRIFIVEMTLINYPGARFKILDTWDSIDSVGELFLSFAHKIKKRYHLVWHIPKEIYLGSNLILPDIYLVIQPFVHNWSGKVMLTANATIQPSQKAFCFSPVQSFNVLWNGDVTLCCVDYNGDLVYDSIDDRNIIAIFNSRKINAIRRNYCITAELPVKCRYCKGKDSSKNGAVVIHGGREGKNSVNYRVKRMFYVYFFRLVWRSHFLNAIGEKWLYYYNAKKWRLFHRPGASGSGTGVK